MEKASLDKNEIFRKVADYYFSQNLPGRYFNVFDTPSSIFFKIEGMVRRARSLRCPHCGKTGILMVKTTVTKKKYRYRKLYVYHETIPVPSRTSLRRQRWCYLNKDDLNDSTVRMSLQKWNHAQDVENFLYRCIVLPSARNASFTANSPSET